MLSLLLLTVLFTVIVRIDSECGTCIPHRPMNGINHLVTYDEFKGNNVYYAYPDKALMNVVDEKFFLNEFNFKDSFTNDTFFAGAKNTLYEFNSSTLEVVQSYLWPAIQSDIATCKTTAQDPNVACENYIRLYKKLPFDNAENRLLVCGTGAFNVTCRTLDLTDISNTNGEGPATPNLDIGIISIHPLVPFAGDFLDNPTEGYQTTGYTEVGNLNTFDFARYDLSYNNGTMAITFDTQPSRTILTTNDFHIKAPYLPVKLIKQHFNNEDKYKMFYFFIRERKYYSQVSDAVPVRARIIRVCQQDEGLDIGANNLFFKTYMKLEMLCFGDPLNTPKAIGTQEHYYTVLRDIVQTDTGSRWNGNTNVWYKLVYGIFTGDVYGPNGTAICVYHAHFSSNSLLDNSNRGIVDVFNFNQFRDEQAAKQSGNGLLSCDVANARDVAESDHIIAVDPIRPYFGLSLPLVEMEGETFTKILTHQVCVSQFNDPDSCLMQDVLIVGTNKGRVKKIVFTTIENSINAELNGLTHDAIIAQEWELADGNSVEQLTLKDGMLYVGTYTRIYKFPIANCERHLNCGDCVGSRDPYCAWDTTNDGKCVRHDVGTAGQQQSFTFNSTNLLQNIHTGKHSKCGLLPQCSLTMTATGSNSISVTGLDNCTNADSYSVTISPFDGCEADVITASITENNSTIINNAILGRRLYNVTVTATGANGQSSYFDYVLTSGGVPVAPGNGEVFSRGVNQSHVEVTVSLDGCNIHDELQDHMICVNFTGSNICQEYNGVNSFVSGPYQGSESIDYFVTVKNDNGDVTTSTPLSVTTRSSAPNPPSDLIVDNIGTNTVKLQWMKGNQGFNTVTGYSIYVDGVKRTDCSTSNTSYTLYGLYSFTDYNFSVSACSEGGESNLESTKAVTACDRPFPVRNLYVTEYDSTSLTFEWDPPSYTNGTEITYTVLEQCYNASSLFVDEETVTNAVSPHTITNLEPLTRCCLDVIVVAKCGNRQYQSELIMSCNQTEDGNPGPVEDLQVTSPNPNALFVTWSAPLNYSNPSLVYEIEWELEGVLIDADIIMNRLYYFIVNLTESTNYTIIVTPVANEVGYGPKRMASFTTLPRVPPRPEDVSISFDDCDMMVNWSYENQDIYNITRYDIRAHCNRQFYQRSVDKHSSSIFYEEPLDICSNGTVTMTWCTAQVRAINTVGNGDYSIYAENVYIQETPPRPMCFITVDLGTAVYVSYTITVPYALDSLSVNYILDPLPGNISLKNHTFTGNNVLNFTGLHRTTKYHLELILCDTDSNICSDPCILNFTTNLVPPAPPTNIVTTQITDSQFAITWDPPSTENSSFLKYIVHVTGKGTNIERTTTDNVTIVTGLSPDSNYYYVIQSIETSANLTGYHSDSITVHTLLATPAIPLITEVEFVNATTITLSIWWNLTYELSITVEAFTFAWTAEVDFIDCNNTYNSRSMNVTDRSSRYLNISDLQGFNSDAGYICMRSVNQLTTSEWVKSRFDVELLRTTVGGVASTEVPSIGLLSGVVLLAIIAIAIAIILVIVLVFVIHKHKPFRDQTSTDGGEPKEVLDGGNFDYPPGDSRTPPKRYESTRSTSSRTAIIPRGRNHNDGESGCCNVA